MVLAHGIGTRADLPVPTALAAIGAGLVLVISFAALAALWRRPRFSGGDAGRPLPAALQRLLDAPVLRILLQAAALAAVVTVCVVGLAGPDSTVLNLAPWIFYITFWVGIVPASLLLGPVWRVLNPLRLLHTIIARALRLDRERGMIVLPDRLGYWPATVSIAVFAWFELVYPGRAEPAAVVTFVLCYGAVNVVAALLVGRRWFERGDGFEVYSVLLAAMAPVGRRTDGTLVVRNPFQGLGALHTAPGLVGFVVVLVGSTAYDGLSRTGYWQANVPAGTANATLALACSVLLIGVLYLLGTWSLIAPGEPTYTPSCARRTRRGWWPTSAANGSPRWSATGSTTRPRWPRPTSASPWAPWAPTSPSRPPTWRSWARTCATSPRPSTTPAAPARSCCRTSGCRWPSWLS